MQSSFHGISSPFFSRVKVFRGSSNDKILIGENDSIEPGATYLFDIDIRSLAFRSLVNKDLGNLISEIRPWKPRNNSSASMVLTEKFFIMYQDKPLDEDVELEFMVEEIFRPSTDQIFVTGTFNYTEVFNDNYSLTVEFELSADGRTLWKGRTDELKIGNRTSQSKRIRVYQNIEKQNQLLSKSLKVPYEDELWPEISQLNSHIITGNKK